MENLRKVVDLIAWVVEIRDECCPITSYRSATRCSRNIVVSFDSFGIWAQLIQKYCSFVPETKILKIAAVGPGSDPYEGKADELVSSNILGKIQMRTEEFFRDHYSVEWPNSPIILDIDDALGQGVVLLEDDTLRIDGTTLFEFLLDLLRKHCASMIALVSLNALLIKNLGMLFKDEVRISKQREFGSIASLVIVGVKAVNSPARDKWASVSSRQQFQQCLRYYHHHLGHTISLKFKHIRSTSVGVKLKERMMEIIQTCLDADRDDEKIYRSLYDYCVRHKAEMSVTQSDRDSGRSESRLSEIQAFLPDGFNAISLVDVGCSEGNITAAVGLGLGLSKENIHGCDVRDLTVTSGFTFSRILPSNILPYESSSKGLVISLMVLHHVEELDSLLKEIYRILRPGGFFIIREHDCKPENLAMILDIMHGLYACVWSDPPEMPSRNFCDYYWASYKTREEWLTIITSHGFKQMFPTRASRTSFEVIDPDHSVVSTRNGPIVKQPYRTFYAVFERL